MLHHSASPSRQHCYPKHGIGLLAALASPIEDRLDVYQRHNLGLHLILFYVYQPLTLGTLGIHGNLSSGGLEPPAPLTPSHNALLPPSGTHLPDNLRHVLWLAGRLAVCVCVTLPRVSALQGTTDRGLVPNIPPGTFWPSPYMLVKAV